MTHSIVAFFVASGILVSGIQELFAQEVTSREESFILRVGRDTTGLERFASEKGGIRGELAFRSSPWLYYTIHFNENGHVAEIDLREHPPFAEEANSTSMRRVEVAFHADSAYERVTRNGETTVRQRFAGFGAVPLLYPSFALIELATMRAKASRATEAEIPFLEIGYQNRNFAASISWIAPDSAKIELGGLDVHVKTDAAGRVLRAHMPARNLTAERVRTSAELRKPDYSAPPNADYSAEEVRILTPGENILVGTLTRPRLVAGRVSVAVLIPGTGRQDRDGMLEGIGGGGYRPFREIAEALAARGVAVFRYDKRGVGGSTVGSGTTTADLAEDMRAVVQYLRSRSDLDAQRVALIGHSEGALIAPLVAASDQDLRAIALLAGPSRTGRAVLTDQFRAQVDPELTLSMPVRDSIVAARLDQIEASASAWMRFFLNYDPQETARNVRTPVLILHGETDQQVTPVQARELEAAFRSSGNKDVTVHLLPNVNHMFLDDPVGHTSQYFNLPSARLNEKMVRLLTEWIAHQLR